MIKNERQYRITKAQAEKFDHALSQIAQDEQQSLQLHPLLRKAQSDALRSQRDELRQQLGEYDALRSGKRNILEIESFDELPRALIQARIAAGMNQKQLAERLGLKEQQIQQYEATEYAGASFSRVREVIHALEILVREDVFLPSAQVSKARLFQRMDSVGVEPKHILKKILPSSIAARLQAVGDTSQETLGNVILQAAAYIGRVYGFKPSVLFGNAPLHLNSAAMAAARFKTPMRSNEQKLSAYTVYAHYLSLLALEATSHLEKKVVPTDARAIREAIKSQYGAITFENALRYVWSLGIPVLPLNDSGTFHGACWRSEGRNVIVLKQGVHSLARWLFDLIHELRHAGEEPDADVLAVIESDETSSERRNSPEEQEASRVAGEVVLDGRAEALAQQAVQAAHGEMPRLKRAVTQVAAREGVAVDSLANYIAWRLAVSNGENWWGTANALQTLGVDPWKVARELFLDSARFEVLNEVDRNLLLQALSDIEG